MIDSTPSVYPSSLSLMNNEEYVQRIDPLRTTSQIPSSSSHPRLSLPNVDHIQQLRREVERLKRELNHTQEGHRQKMEQLLREEQEIRNENLRLQRKLQLEVSEMKRNSSLSLSLSLSLHLKVDRREQLCRQLSESESSLEMDEERALNERIKLSTRQHRTSSSQQHLSRSRTVSSPSSNIHSNLLEHLSSSSSLNNNDFQKPKPPSNNQFDQNNQME